MKTVDDRRHYPRQPDTLIPPPGQTCRRGHTDLRGTRIGDRVKWDCRVCAAHRGRLRRDAAAPKVRTSPKVINGRVMLDNGPLREIVQREMRMDPLLTWDEIALRAGYTRKNGRGDHTHMKRVLGIVLYRQRDRGGALREYALKRINEDMALRIARAVHADPWEIGL